MFARLLPVALLMGAASGAANAQSSKPASASKSDPNRVVCERVEQIGTRLATKRVCMTVAQWRDQQAADRAEIQREQQKNR